MHAVITDRASGFVDAIRSVSESLASGMTFRPYLCMNFNSLSGIEAVFPMNWIWWGDPTKYSPSLAFGIIPGGSDGGGASVRLRGVLLLPLYLLHEHRVRVRGH